MDTTLRPLTLGEILDRTAQLYRSNFLLLAGIASVYASVLLVLALAQIGVDEALRINNRSDQLTLSLLIGTLVILPVIVIVGGFAVAANNRAVAWLHLGHPATIRSAWLSIRPRLGRFLWLMTITTGTVWLPFVLIYGGYMGLFFVYARPRGLLTQPGFPADQVALLVFGLATMVFLVLIVAWVVWAVIMGLRYSLAVPACVVEDLPARQAIRRSIELSRGSRGRILLLGLLVAAIQIGLGMITQIFFVISTLRHHGELPATMRALQQVVAFFTNTFVGPIYATGFTLFYYDQRVRKEGYDIEWMMQAAGLSASPADAGARSGSGTEAQAVAETAELNPASPAGRVDE
jgi:uncharacterized membrane protein